MCEQDSASPALQPKQCGDRMVPSLSAIIQMFTSESAAPLRRQRAYWRSYTLSLKLRTQKPFF